MKPADWIIVGLVAAAVAAAIVLIVRRKKRGGSCCGGADCADCSACAKNTGASQKKADK